MVFKKDDYRNKYPSNQETLLNEVARKLNLDSGSTSEEQKVQTHPSANDEHSRREEVKELSHV